MVVLPLSLVFFRVTCVGPPVPEACGYRGCLAYLGGDVHSCLVEVLILGSLALESVLVRACLGACTRGPGPLRKMCIAAGLGLGT